MFVEVALTCCMSSGMALAQQAVPLTQSFDAASLDSNSRALLQKARDAQFGVASEVLLNRPDGSLQMAVRVKSGQAEWHRDDADILIGVEGSARIVTGGAVVNGKDTAPGEMRGDSIKGGTVQAFGPGDYVRIEPRVAHQMLLAPGTTLRYMAVKVRITR